MWDGLARFLHPFRHSPHPRLNNCPCLASRADRLTPENDKLGKSTASWRRLDSPLCLVPTQDWTGAPSARDWESPNQTPFLQSPTILEASTMVPATG